MSMAKTVIGMRVGSRWRRRRSPRSSSETFALALVVTPEVVVSRCRIGVSP
jgi:hypothetical protein